MSLLTGFLAFVTAIAAARRSSDAPKTPEADFIARIEHQREVIEAQGREIAALVEARHYAFAETDRARMARDQAVAMYAGLAAPPSSPFPPPGWTQGGEAVPMPPAMRQALMEFRPNEAVEVPEAYTRAAQDMLNRFGQDAHNWAFCTCTPSRADMLRPPPMRPHTP